jgi:hypothetical protein
LKYKLFKIFVCTLLIIAVVIPVSGNISNSQIEDTITKENLYFQPSETWNKTFGGVSSDSGYFVRQTTDGGYIVSGTTNGPIGDVFLVKTDTNGNKQWDDTYGIGSGYCVQQTSDGGYIITGDTGMTGDVKLIKTDGNGNEQWNTTFGASKTDVGYNVQQTSDGGFIIAGASVYVGPPGTWDAWLIKTDSSGTKQWDNKFGSTYEDYFYSVKQTSDGGYICTGATNPTNTNLDVYLVKTDSSGNAVWTKNYGGSNDDYGWSVQQTADSGYIISGWTESYGAGNSDAYLIKTDSSGNVEWTKTFGGVNFDYIRYVGPTVDGGFIIIGSTTSFGAGQSDIYLIKTDSSGTKQWEETYGGAQNDYGWCAQETADGGIIIAGETSSYGAGLSDVWLIKLGGTLTFKLTFLLGGINNVVTVGTNTQFDAVNLFCIQFSPFKFVNYNSGETVTISNKIIGFMSSNFIFGFFNAAI